MRLLVVAAEPVAFAVAQLQVSASLGVSFYTPERTVNIEALMREADAAMYQAKESGKNRFRFYASKDAADTVVAA